MNIPRLLLPILVIVALFGGYVLRAAFTQPSTAVEYTARGEANLECIVEGVKCKGTAGFFTSLYDGVPGIASITTYATEHKAVFTYDPAAISADRIKEIMEAEIPLRDGTSRQIFDCLSMNGETDN